MHFLASTPWIFSGVLALLIPCDTAVTGPDLERCIASPAAPLQAFLKLAGIYQSERNDAALLRTVVAGLRRFPKERRFALTAGTLAARQGDYTQAIALLQPFAQDPQAAKLLASALFARGTKTLDAGDNAAAARDLQHAVELAPGDVEARMNLGRALHNLQRYTEALAAFNAVTNFPLLHFHKATTHLAAGQFEQAINEATAEIESNSDFAPAYLVRGKAHLSLGNTQAAIPDLERAGAQQELKLARARGSRTPARSTASEVRLEAATNSGINIQVTTGDPHEKRLLIEAMGGGLAVLDYNNDGWMDLYVVNAKPPARSALYRNNKDGTFTDVTLKAGVPNKHWGQGALAADLNNDGHTDLYLCNFGPNVLYLNNGDGTFRDATQQAGVGDPRWSSAAAAADFDNDGDLDIFVANYLDYDLNTAPTKGEHCSYRGFPVSCGPRGLKGAGDALYRNAGDGTFTEVSKQLGVHDAEGYYGLGAAWGDYDNDGDPDLFVANDATPNRLYRNDNGKFIDVAVEAGVAYSEDGREQSSMGVEFEDLDNDGWLDIMVTNFSEDYNTLYINSGKGHFRDESARAGLVANSWRDLSWGVGFFDFDNNGRKDVFVASGHIYPQVDRATKDLTYRQHNKLYLNDGLTPVKLPGAKSYRGAAFADFNNDGRIDVAVSALDDTPVLLLNRTENANNWLLVQAPVGTRVYIGAQMREIKAGGSYASTNDPRAHFGLGAQTQVDLKIIWPGGKATMISTPSNRVVTLKQ